MAEEWWTHPALGPGDGEIVFAGADGRPVRCAVVAGVFRAPEGIRLGPPYRPAPAPQQAREARRRDAVAAIREELLRAGLSVEELLAALRGAETAAEEAAAAPPTEMAAGEPAAEPADDTAAEGVTTAAAGWRRR
jgi:hypothetical protein